MILQTTLSLAAAAAIMNIWLAFRAGKLRYNAKILHGDGGNPLLMQRMRAQANFVENTPFVLILIAVIEMTGKGGTWLAIVGRASAMLSAWTTPNQIRCARSASWLRRSPCSGSL